MNRDLLRRENEHGDSRQSEYAKAQKQQRRCHIWRRVSSSLQVERSERQVSDKIDCRLIYSSVTLQLRPLGEIKH